MQLRFSLDREGEPVYSVNYGNKPVVLWSRLGFALSADSLFYKGFSLRGSEQRAVDDRWKPVWGEVAAIRDHYQQLTVHLQKGGAAGLWLDIVFRVFEDGVGFRYVFPKQAGLTYFIVTDERTEFHLAGDHKSFWIPGDYDTNEYPYTTSKLSEVDNRALVAASTAIAVRVAPDPHAVQTPLMMKTADGLYLNIHEAGLAGYSAMQLHVDAGTLTLSASLVPDAVGNKAYLHAPAATPWRTIIVSDKAADILASKMILNLNEPSKLTVTDWIHPMKFVGVWWEMQTGKGTWSYSDYADSVSAGGASIPNGRHSANTANVKRYIDFAAKNHIGGVLVEGWNVGWEDWF
ncbi:MAG TPA: glycoside hydrolase family 97 N-terminal domain-containing protein, partial [Puia sp.]|nr:glycoside hydrolase family 97 N-terminal domain-containing protein [Puia sp.]